MKKFSLVFVFVSIVIISFSQVPVVEWQEKIGSNNDDEFYSVVNSGGSYGIGGMQKDINDQAQGWFISVSDFGQTFWERKLNFTDKTLISSVAINRDYSYTIAGYTYERKGYRRDLFYMRLDSKGQKISKKVMGGKFKDGASNVLAVRDGGDLIIGYFSEDENENIWAIRVNKFSSEMWQKTYDITEMDHSVSSVFTFDGNFMICANTYTSQKKWDVSFIRINAETGVQKWIKTIGDDFNNSANDFIRTWDSAYVFCGVTETEETAKDLWVVKIDDDTNIIWEKTFGWSMNEEANAIYEKSDGNLLVCGYTESKGNGMLDFWVMELDGDGNLLWEQTFGSDANDVAYDITEADDGGIVVVGSTFDGENKLDGYVIKLAY
ncbi:MAG: hypothetical protein JXL97_15650 [Bacteroidales bacterium]|nr:hypothetical protein [Bacteroidales bacterium]